MSEHDKTTPNIGTGNAGAQSAPTIGASQAQQPNTSKQSVADEIRGIVNNFSEIAKQEDEKTAQGSDAGDAPPQESANSDRPEWLKQNFETPEAQAQAYLELEKLHGKVNNEFSKVKDYFGAPKDGYDVPDELAKKLDEKGAGILTEFTDFAEKNNFSQKMHEEMVGFLAKWEAAKVTDAAKEISGMHEGVNRYSEIMGWLKANFNSDDIKSLQMPVTAGNILFLEKVRDSMSGQSNIPSNNQTQSIPAGNGRTAEEMQHELGSGDNLTRFKSDNFYRKDFIERTRKRIESEQGRG